MATWSEPDPPLTPRAREGLARGLDVLDAHTEAPLRVRGHAGARGAEVFDLQEEFEVGPRGRRFLVTVDLTGREAMLLAMGGDPGEIE